MRAGLSVVVDLVVLAGILSAGDVANQSGASFRFCGGGDQGLALDWPSERHCQICSKNCYLRLSNTPIGALRDPDEAFLATSQLVSSHVFHSSAHRTPNQAKRRIQNSMLPAPHGLL